MQGWPGGPPSLARLNPIYSEAEDSAAGRSKASSSGYGSQRGSGGGSVSDRPPPPLPLRGSDKSHQSTLWHPDGSEDPYTIYSTCSVRDEITQDDYVPRKHSYSTIGKGKFSTSDVNFLTKHSRYLPKVGRGYKDRSTLNGDYYSTDNQGFISDDKADTAYGSDGYVSKEASQKANETLEVINKSDSGNLSDVERTLHNYDSMQADPFLLYSQFIRQEEEKAQINDDREILNTVKILNSLKREEVINGVEDIVESASDKNGVSLSVAREDYLRALLQDVAVALEEALAVRRLEPQGQLLQEARERVALGLVALRRAGPDELKQLSKALSRGPPRPLPRPTTPPPPTPHTHKPSLWYQYYMRANSLNSTDSINTCFAGELRPEAQFTLGAAGERRLAGRLASARKARCVCRLLAATLALVFFVLALVLCSLLLSGGRAMFGSMM